MLIIFFGAKTQVIKLLLYLIAQNPKTLHALQGMTKTAVNPDIQEAGTNIRLIILLKAKLKQL